MKKAIMASWRKYNNKTMGVWRGGSACSGIAKAGDGSSKQTKHQRRVGISASGIEK